MKKYTFLVFKKTYEINAFNYSDATIKLILKLKKEGIVKYIKQIDISKIRTKIFVDNKDRRISEKKYLKMFSDNGAIDKLEKLIKLKKIS